jgi:hypothetical protein
VSVVLRASPGQINEKLDIFQNNIVLYFFKKKTLLILINPPDSQPKP